MTTLIAIDRDPDYAPCCYLVCRVKNPDAGEGHYDWNTRDEKNTVLIQSDWDYPGLARTFGFAPKAGWCQHPHTDGTVQCPDCGMAAGDFIKQAAEFLDYCAEKGKVVEDPGYFDEEAERE